MPEGHTQACRALWGIRAAFSVGQRQAHDLSTGETTDSRLERTLLQAGGGGCRERDGGFCLKAIVGSRQVDDFRATIEAKWGGEGGKEGPSLPAWYFLGFS